MNQLSVLLVTAAVFVASAVGQLTINTPPPPVVCEPTQFTWSGGTAPYFLSIQPGNQPTAPSLEDLGQQNGTSFTWIANLAAGTSIGLQLRDSTGAIAQSAPITIQAGSSTACIGQPQSTVTGGTPPPTSGAATPPTTTGAATTAPPATPPPGQTSPKATSTTPASTSGAPSASASKSASYTLHAQLEAAGILGVAILALLA